MLTKFCRSFINGNKLWSRLYFLNWRCDFSKPMLHLRLNVKVVWLMLEVLLTLKAGNALAYTASDHEHLNHGCWDRATDHGSDVAQLTSWGKAQSCRLHYMRPQRLLGCKHTTTGWRSSRQSAVDSMDRLVIVRNHRLSDDDDDDVLPSSLIIYLNSESK